jgi:hypothetical protein
MRIERGKLDTPLVVGDELALDGMACAGVRVTSAGFLQLNGMVIGDVIVEPNGRAIVNGTVSGDVLNRGGDVQINGVVAGQVEGDADHTKIDPKAIVGKH